MSLSKEIVFYINNLAYSFDVDEQLHQELIRFLKTDRNLSTEDLLLAYIRKSNEFISFKNEIKKISDKLPSPK